MKKRLWQIHSWLGLIAGLGLLIIGVTGSLLVFRDQLDGLVAPKLTRVEPTVQGRLSWDALLVSAQNAWPEYEVTGFGSRREPDLADLVYMVKRGDHEYRGAFLDPYTGEGRGSPMQSSDSLTGILLELHYTWFADHIGMLITGILAAMLCILGLTGVWLYRDFWRNFFTLRWGRSARIFFSDLHKMVGISSVVFNLILGFTGAYWNLMHVAAEGLSHEEEEQVMTKRLYADSISLDAMAVEAARAIPGFRPGWVSLPTPAEPEITLWGRSENGHFLTGPYGCNAVFDAQTGAMKSTHDIRNAGLWERIFDTFTPLHYGTFGGWAIKVLWCLGGLAPGILGISGFMVWRSRRRRPTNKAGGATTSVEMSPVQ
jgi:uncharacterized iron-regulated membrane protein